jgi:hypothetical protein
MMPASGAGGRRFESDQPHVKNKCSMCRFRTRRLTSIEDCFTPIQDKGRK